MGSLFDGTDGMDEIEKIYNQMEANCPNPHSTSKRLWELRHACKIPSHKPEILLERAVAMLAARGHMQGWFNQCPTASGINDSSRNRHSDVDLVHWDEANKCARLVELKWESNDPPSALRQVLGYGAAYIFCLVHRGTLPLQERPLMDARHVSIEVVAPAPYYFGYNLKDRIAQMSAALNKFVDSKISGLTMSLKVLAFPKGFDIPFKNGQEVRDKCDKLQLTAEGRKVRDAFDNLTQLWP